MSCGVWPAFRHAVFASLLFVSSVVTRADAPTVDALFPAGGARGSTNEVTLSGKFSPWPPKVWVDRAGVSFEAKTNSGKFVVTVARDAEPGPRLVRFYNEDGASTFRFFVVGSDAEAADTEPNNHFAKPQSLHTLPVTINGRLEKRDDVDSFAVPMRAGEWLEARTDSYVLMSKVDPVLRLVTSNGVQLAWNHDFIGLDPRLVWRASNDCTVVLQSFGFAYPADAEIRFAGGDSTTYRLHVSTTNREPSFCAEPNIPSSRRVELPVQISGVIAQPRDEHRIELQIVKDEFLEAEVRAAAFGSPLDASLRIENQAGHVLARNDDADNSPDPRLEWKAASNGVFAVVIGSTTHRGGADHCYRLLLRRAEPDCRVSLMADSLVLTAGATNELKFNVKRLRGFKSDLSVAFRDLPPGVTVLETNLGAKDGAVSLKLSASADAPVFQGPMRVLVRDDQGTERPAIFELTSRSEDNGVPGGYSTLLVKSTEQVWLTVKPQKKPVK